MREMQRRVAKLEAAHQPATGPAGPAVLIYRPGETTEAAAARLGIALSRTTTLVCIPDNGR
ncbi:hypothetical protein [Azospirillum sp. TSO35-2]|uniref:hypothetical protein n=1 Tax=Azospirillum sp. TSO35-2 TaxID=716796 RepID=UPI0011B5C2A7|nr:hypothetical protein [Azospirillum sp. TSO35-2]